ncbi:MULTISPECIES: hypothetical protein [Pseudonocardia]|uniref:Uncharacterized protein n=2 Tax=Pseudonocardia TaxID=1847 RepID=A0A1Y2N560_PSEAH|nr:MULTISPECIES: hypothetical protein [Pseudonocardia]OSY42058.1 hypothetical protein BG845_01554 [Pseudonocardia autotrophica]TDN75173.1 hypothetical protein C8E95_4317 [Pseudonocardia autotrophica]BBF99118.1 hypothetical protein Pdca_03280 [Pseudonocardia autotrophica]GEC24038.1 hypothetical protein PSA01_10670 [Pseudonocardia saturnea]
MHWSVSIRTQGDRTITHDEVLRLADAVAAHRGVASGIGTPGYGAQIVVTADDEEQALRRGREVFAEVVERAGLPAFEVVGVDAVSEEDDANPDPLP